MGVEVSSEHSSFAGRAQRCRERDFWEQDEFNAEIQRREMAEIELTLLEGAIFWGGDFC